MRQRVSAPFLGGDHHRHSFCNNNNPFLDVLPYKLEKNNLSTSQTLMAPIIATSNENLQLLHDFYRETKRARADGLTRKQAQELVTMGKIILRGQPFLFLALTVIVFRKQKFEATFRPGSDHSENSASNEEDEDSAADEESADSSAAEVINPSPKGAKPIDLGMVPLLAKVPLLF